MKNTEYEYQTIFEPLMKNKLTKENKKVYLSTLLTLSIGIQYPYKYQSVDPNFVARIHVTVFDFVVLPVNSNADTFPISLETYRERIIYNPQYMRYRDQCEHRPHTHPN